MSLYKNDTGAGYFLITLRPTNHSILLTSNNERAFVLSCLQDALTARFFPEMHPLRQNLASHVDLLAFSILKEAIQLVVFAISSSSAQSLATLLIKQIDYYHDNWNDLYGITQNKPETTTIIRPLVGPHDALRVSTQLHTAHTDWEYDRYSSIGFYLHDRRGDWMRIWRLCHLYDSVPENYRNLMLFALRGFCFEESESFSASNKTKLGP